MTNHIKAIHDDNVSVCGDALGNDFYFKTVEAAILNGIHEPSKPACRHCTDVLIQNLVRGTLTNEDKYK